jgi:hypothetical protein
VKKYLKKAFPACLGSSFGVTLARALPNTDGDIWKDFLIGWPVSFAIIVVVVAVLFWLWDLIRKK